MSQPVRLLASAAELRAAAVILAGERFHYAIRVRRLGKRDAIELFDGAGWRRAFAVASIDVDTANLEPTGEPARDRGGVRISNILPLIKGERMEWAISKLTELGSVGIAPVRTERTVVELDDARAKRRVERYQRLAEAAARQSGRADVPLIEMVTDLTAAIDDASAQLKIIFALTATRSLVEVLADSGSGELAVALATGPEGGFAATEVARAERAGFQVAGLGPRILRAETAAIAATAVVAALRGDLA